MQERRLYELSDATLLLTKTIISMAKIPT